jgi:hypothetical protein
MKDNLRFIWIIPIVLWFFGPIALLLTISISGLHPSKIWRIVYLVLAPITVPLSFLCVVIFALYKLFAETINGNP